jgi:hypothetical protein
MVSSMTSKASACWCSKYVQTQNHNGICTCTCHGQLDEMASSQALQRGMYDVAFTWSITQ